MLFALSQNILRKDEFQEDVHSGLRLSSPQSRRRMLQQNKKIREPASGLMGNNWTLIIKVFATGMLQQENIAVSLDNANNLQVATPRVSDEHFQGWHLNS